MWNDWFVPQAYPHKVVDALEKCSQDRILSNVSAASRMHQLGR